MDVLYDSPATVPAPARNAYSHAVRVDVGTGALLFVAGQVAAGDDGGIVGPGDMGAQTRRTFDLVGRILAAHGADFGNVVNVRSYLTDMDLLDDYVEARRPYLTENLPASTAVEVTRLFHPDVLLEVELVAAIPAG